MSISASNHSPLSLPNVKHFTDFSLIVVKVHWERLHIPAGCVRCHLDGSDRHLWGLLGVVESGLGSSAIETVELAIVFEFEFCYWTTVLVVLPLGRVIANHGHWVCQLVRAHTAYQPFRAFPLVDICV